MGYKIYYKNTIRGGFFSTGGRFEQYDRKNYPTKEKAEEALKKYNRMFKKSAQQLKKKGIKEKYEIRATTKKKRPSSGFMFGW